MALEDPRWSWPPPAGVGADKDGCFEVRGFAGTPYRLHAISHTRKTVSAEPVTIEPGTGRLNVRLVLTREGNSLAESSQKALERWRKGLGL